MLPERLREAGLFGPAIKQLQQAGEVEVRGRIVRLEDVSLPRPGQAVTYLPPCRPSEAARRLSEGAAVLVCRNVRRARDGELAAARGELTTHEVAAMAEVCGVAQVVLTGFHPGVEDPRPHVDEVAERFSSVRSVEDGDRFEIPRPRKPTAA